MKTGADENGFESGAFWEHILLKMPEAVENGFEKSVM